MEITKQREGDRLIVYLSGRLSSNTYLELSNALEGALEGITELIIDLEGLEYISSAGLRVLLSTHKRMKKQGEMRIRNVQKAVMEVFEVTFFSDFLTIES